eukprot:6187297-Pleurochrysis_carterae.AAC.2
MARSASYAHTGSAPRAPPRCLRRTGTGTALLRADASLIATTCTTTHSYPPLAADGGIHCTDPHVRSRVGSNARSCGCPTSPARSRRLWASSVAAHSTRPCAVRRQSHASATRRKWVARNALLSFLVPCGGSSCRMRFNAIASAPPPSSSGAMLHPASRDRSSLTADT